MKFKQRDLKVTAELRKRLKSKRTRKLDIYAAGEEAHKPSKPQDHVRQGVQTPDGLIDEVIAAQLLNLSVSTLQNRRSLRQPPAYIKRGRKVFYDRELIERLKNLPQSQW